jgi:putative methyltransferase (TIGR04325 family)
MADWVARLRRHASQWCPPIVAGCVRKVLVPAAPAGDIVFRGDFQNWEEAAKASTGYDSDLIVARVMDATRKVIRGDASYEQDSVPFDRISYPWPLLANLLFAAASCGGRLRVLDFGGSLGSTFFRCRRYFQELPELSWAVVEQRRFVESGRELEGAGLRFYSSADEAWNETRPHVLLLSGVLQYLSLPHEELKSLLTYPWKVVIVDRTAMLPARAIDRLTVQTVPASIYEASYPAWFLSKQKFESMFHPAYEIISSWVNGDFYRLDGDETSFEGYCFARRPTGTAGND